jgi:hypothetical protein
VTRLGEISPIGRYFLALGAFFSEKYLLYDLVAIFFNTIGQISPKSVLDYDYFLPLNSQILNINFFRQNSLFRKAPFWAKFQPNWALYFTKHLVTLFPSVLP